MISWRKLGDFLIHFSFSGSDKEHSHHRVFVWISIRWHSDNLSPIFTMGNLDVYREPINLLPSLNGATSVIPGPSSTRTPSLLKEGEILSAPANEVVEAALCPLISGTRSEALDRCGGDHH